MKMFKKFFQRDKKVDDRLDIKSRFDLISKTGSGSMSQVWKANDRLNDQIVALKIIDPVKLKYTNARFPDGTLPQEGVIASSLNHPYIVKTFEYGMNTRYEPYLVMEFLEGYGLLGYGLLQFIELQSETMRNYYLKWMIQLGHALQYFHEQDWIHRDFCPKNILTNVSGDVKLIDFGLVVPNTPPFREPGNRTGTVDYMAPELVKRQKTDQRIDIYSYAVTCYQMCTNRLPYPQGRTIEAIVKNINRPPEDIRKYAPALPEPIAKIVMRGLEKNPDDRWQTAKEMVEAFEQIAEKM